MPSPAATFPFHLMTREFTSLCNSRLAPHGVAAFNFYSRGRSFRQQCSHRKLAFDNLDFFNSGDRALLMSNVIVLGRLDPSSEEETLQKAVAAQARYKFRFDVSKLVTERRMPVPKAQKGDVLTDDFGRGRCPRCPWPPLSAREVARTRVPPAVRPAPVDLRRRA